MALKILDSLKKIDIGKVTEVVSEVSETISDVFSREKQDDKDSAEPLKPQPESQVSEQVATTMVVPSAEKRVQSIETLDSLSDYLMTLQVGAPSAVISALNSQLQVLKYVQSPTMTLMAVDNIMLCLYRSLAAAESEEQKASLRDVYSSLLQSFIFVTEARLRYEIESNKEESVALLADAGDMLVQSIGSVAMLAVPGAVAAKGAAAGVSAARSMPKITNVLMDRNTQKGFISRLITVKGKKAMIEEKIDEFDKTLNYIFDTLDKYAPLIGPSIQLHGMLRRYADGMVERYKDDQFEAVSKRLREKDSSLMDDFTQLATEAVSVRSKVAAVGLMLKAVTTIVKSRQAVNYNAVTDVVNELKGELGGIEQRIAALNEIIAATETEIASLSFVQFSRKSELQKKVDQNVAQRDELVKQAADYRHKISVAGSVIEPVNEQVAQYEEHLMSIVRKFEVVL